MQLLVLIPFNVKHFLIAVMSSATDYQDSSCLASQAVELIFLTVFWFSKI